jgi:hypothetical protein
VLVCSNRDILTSLILSVGLVEVGEETMTQLKYMNKLKVDITLVGYLLHLAREVISMQRGGVP